MRTTDLTTLLDSIMSASHLVWPVLLVASWLFARSRSRVTTLAMGMALLVCITFVYGRFIERYYITETPITLERGFDARVVLIADQHLGRFKDAAYLQRVVDRINAVPDVDFVVIAGDFVYGPQDLAAEHAPLRDIAAPVYAVLGNHDVVTRDEKQALTDTLINLGVTVLENDIVEEAGVTIYGLGSRIAHTDDVTLIAQADPTNENILILTHNPDTTQQPYPDVDISNSVTLTGHTHCGQIRIPGLYQHLIPTVGSFPDRGPYDLGRKGTLLITCGLGEVALPLRLFNPPEIVVLDL